jgi:hypothetical protein
MIWANACCLPEDRNVSTISFARVACIRHSHPARVSQGPIRPRTERPAPAADEPAHGNPSATQPPE